MAELVDALDSKSSDSNIVRVQVPPAAHMWSMTFGTFFDIIIVMGISVCSILASFFVRDRGNPSTWAARHKTMSSVLITALLLGAGTLVYGSFIEPRLILTTEYEVDIAADLTEPITVVLYADPQVGPYKRERFMQRVVNKINALDADLVLGAGDMVMNDGSQTEDETKWLEPLFDINTIHFMISGNHEHGLGNPYWTARTGNVKQQYYDRMHGQVFIMDNSRAVIDLKGQPFTIYGLDDLWSRQMDLESFGNAISQDPNPNIVMAHNPDTVLAWLAHAQTEGIDPTAVDLIVSGHTHGGQIRLPFIGPLGNPNVIIPRKFFKGISTWGDVPVLITSGLGESGPRARLLTPPEIVVVTIK